MDVQEFWEENKRWLLGALLGLVVFLVARSIVSYEGSSAQQENARAIGVSQKVMAKSRYGTPAVREARKEGTALQEQMDRLLTAMVFTPGSAYVIDGSTPPDLQFNNSQQALVRSLEDLADYHGVDLERNDIQWSTPQTPDQRRSTLVGMALIDASMRRLFAAHEQVRDASPTATGVRAIRKLSVGKLRNRPRPSRRGSRARRGSVDATQYLREETMSFEIEADSATLHRWLEACRGENNPMSMTDLAISGPRRPGEPVVAKGTLAAVTFDRARFDEDLQNAGREAN